MGNLRNRVYRLLRRSEEYFKTDMVYLAKGSFWLNSSQFGSAFMSFLLSVAFANLLSKEIFGTYKYVLSLANIFGVITLTGLGTAIARAVAMGKEGELMRGIKFNLKWESLVLIASLVSAGYYYLHGNSTLALCLIVIGIFTPIIDSSELYSSFLNGKKNFRLIGLFNILKTAIYVGSLFITMVFTKNVIILVLVYFLVNAATNYIFLRITLRKYRPNPNLDEETLGLAKHTSITNNIAGFADQLDTVLIFHYLGPAALAIYNFSLAIPEYLAGFSKNIGTLAMPKYAQSEVNKSRETIYHKSFYIMGFGLAMAIIYMILAKPFFTLFFPRYLDSVILSQIYSLILLSPGALIMAFINSQLAIKQKYQIIIYSNLVRVPLIFIGIYYFGIWGAILAKVVGKFIGVLFGVYFAKKI